MGDSERGGSSRPALRLSGRGCWMLEINCWAVSVTLPLWPGLLLTGGLREIFCSKFSADTTVPLGDSRWRPWALMNFPSAVRSCRPSSLGLELLTGFGVMLRGGLSRLICWGEVLVRDLLCWIVLTTICVRLGDELVVVMLSGGVGWSCNIALDIGTVGNAAAVPEIRTPELRLLPAGSRKAETCLVPSFIMLEELSMDSRLVETVDTVDLTVRVFTGEDLTIFMLLELFCLM